MIIQHLPVPLLIFLIAYLQIIADSALAISTILLLVRVNTKLKGSKVFTYTVSGMFFISALFCGGLALLEISFLQNLVGFVLLLLASLVNLSIAVLIDDKKPTE